MGHEEDIWYAANITEVILSPRQTLETFGTTIISYHIISELMDEVDQVRVRFGKVYSERPQIITPSQFQQMLANFGEQAQEFLEALRAQGDIPTMLRYGLQFRKDAEHEEVLHENIDDVSDRVVNNVESGDDPLTAVIRGADEMWEVSLLKFLSDYVERSGPRNMQDIRARDMAQEKAELDEIERMFIQAHGDSARIKALGKRLQKLGLFEQYEDRFYALLRSV